MKVGTRVRLTGSLVNNNSPYMPVEEGMEPGLEGEVVFLMLDFRPPMVAVNWDNGRSLNLMLTDPFVVVKKEDK